MYRRLFWGLLLVLLGVVFLLDQLGAFEPLGVSAWELLWPLALILLGLWILLGRFLRPKPISGHAVIPLQNARRAHIKIRHGAGELNVAGGAESGALVSGDFAGGLDYETDIEDDQQFLRMRMPPQSAAWVGDVDFSLDWTIKLTNEIPLTLKINTGASKSSLDLSELIVTELKLRTGASATDLILPARAGLTRVEIDAGAASVNVRVPAGVAARITALAGLSTIDVDTARFPSLAERYQSPDYDTAVNKADVIIKAGVGTVDIR